MRLLGHASSLATFRWDLMYLLAQLTTDERPGVSALGAPIETALDGLYDRRLAFEEAQAAAVIAAATVAKRDKTRDCIIVKMGGVARATERDTYTRLFPKHSPSETSRMSIHAQTHEVTRILGEMNTLDASHPLRTGYETALKDAQAALAAAKTNLDDAELALALERSLVERFKVELDKVRIEAHGKLVALLADKSEADAFFRPTMNGPEEKKSVQPPAPPLS